MQHLSLAAAIVLLCALPAPTAHGQAPVAVDRTPLTFRDSGLYANLNCVHGVDPTRDGVSNLLTFERAVRPDTPWDFYIMQYNAKEPSPELAARLATMARNGKKIILRVLLGKEGQKIDTDVAKRRLNDVFEHTRPEWLYAITLDEENVYWHGNTERLVGLYEYAKERWPGLPVYQWWTPMIAPDVRAERGWVALPADGWVMDLYGRRAEEFEKKLIKFLQTGKPLVHIAWASPTWMFHDKEGCTKDDWWDRAGRAVLDEQVRICREYNVPVAYFCCQQAEHKDGKRLAPIRWGWHAVCPATRRWFRELEMRVTNLDFLPTESIGYRQPTPRKFAWAHAAPHVRVTLRLDEQARPRFTWRMDFRDVATAPGEHSLPCPYGNPYVRTSYELDESARHLEDGFALPSIDKRTASAPVVFRLQPLRPMTDWRVSAVLRVTKPLGGGASVAFSTDGETWTEEVHADPGSARPQDVGFDESQTRAARGTSPVWVRVNLRATAGVRTNVAARLQALQASAVLPDEAPAGAMP